MFFWIIAPPTLLHQRNAPVPATLIRMKAAIVQTDLLPAASDHDTTTTFPTKGAHHHFARSVCPAVEAEAEAGPGAVVEVEPVQRPHRAVVQQTTRPPRHELLPSGNVGNNVLRYVCVTSARQQSRENVILHTSD